MDKAALLHPEAKLVVSNHTMCLQVIYKDVFYIVLNYLQEIILYNVTPQNGGGAGGGGDEDEEKEEEESCIN